MFVIHKLPHNVNVCTSLPRNITACAIKQQILALLHEGIKLLGLEVCLLFKGGGILEVDWLKSWIGLGTLDRGTTRFPQLGGLFMVETASIQEHELPGNSLLYAICRKTLQGEVLQCSYGVASHIPRMANLPYWRLIWYLLMFEHTRHSTVSETQVPVRSIPNPTTCCKVAECAIWRATRQ